MRFVRSRGICALAVLTIALLWAGAASAADPSSSAARACAQGASLTAPVGPTDVAFLKRFIPCVVSRLRGSAPTVSPRLSALAAGSLRAGEGATERTAQSILTRSATEAATRYCRHSAAMTFSTGDTTAPPTPSALWMAGLVDQGIAKGSALGRARGTVFGLAFDSHPLIHDASRGSSFFVLAVNCNTKPVKLK